MTAKDVNSSVDIMTCLEKYTGATSFPVNKNIKCPFHQDSKPSMRVYPNSNSAVCFTGCNRGRGIDPINVVMLANNCDFKTAMDTLIQDFNLKSKTSKVEIRRQIANKKSRDIERQKVYDYMSFLHGEITRMKLSLEFVRGMTDSFYIDFAMYEYECFSEEIHYLAKLEYWADLLESDPDEAIRQILEYYKKGRKL